MKIILFSIILIIFLYRYKQQEGFSSAEKDIRASFNMDSVIKTDKEGRICKIGERQKYDKDFDEDEDLDDEKPLILEKESDIVKEETFNKLNNKLDLINVRAGDKLENINEKHSEKIISDLKQILSENEIKELEKINELTNKMNLMHSELQNSKEKEQMFDKLLDKIDIPRSHSYKRNSSNTTKNIILFVVLISLFTVGGYLVYSIMYSGKIRIGDEIRSAASYKEELLKAKQDILNNVV
jgi:hypothetical protein